MVKMNEYMEPLLPFMLIKPQLCRFIQYFCFDALEEEKKLVVPAAQELIHLPANYIVKLIGLGMDALNRPVRRPFFTAFHRPVTARFTACNTCPPQATPVCHRTWHGESCSGPLVNLCLWPCISTASVAKTLPFALCVPLPPWLRHCLCRW